MHNIEKCQTLLWGSQFTRLLYADFPHVLSLAMELLLDILIVISTIYNAVENM